MQRASLSGPYAAIPMLSISQTAGNASAALAGLAVAERRGSIVGVEAIWGGLAGAGESLTVTFTRNGVDQICSFVIDSSKPARVLYEVPFANGAIEVGDGVAMQRVYVAGGSPTPIGINKFVIYFRPAA